ncbi:ribosome silencing factor [Catenisphaera adipataccumulans]|jgi:ribosome-associated protein|uniref:Ribosomal silencing factor RsfS n=1 Tax=Catenisphaera adipataccumulans TaxID=700500 RepID=A0A7W8CYT0_9FIRM|nr:ribosome silencing factor [Catenisphaera adipataccumulans]MBB5183479.1 ribosome-associated protein [Catenisphaera adipataccumulans]
MELKEVVIQAILERKGTHVVDYDCRTLTPFVDDMIVATTMNLRQNNAIARNIKDKVREAGFQIDIRQEGESDSKWILIDLQEVVVHLFVQDERQVYKIDRLYEDCPKVEYDV